MTLISKGDIPVNAGTAELVDFIEKLDVVSSQTEIDAAVDQHMKILNCSQWDPLVSVTMKNKSLLIAELIYEETVRKRLPPINSICEGLKLTGIFTHLKNNIDICREIFVFTGEKLSGKMFWDLIDETTITGNLEYEKLQTVGFFKSMIFEADETTLRGVLQFITGFDIVPPWGFETKIRVEFLEDDDVNIIPKAMACFNILSLPTVHSDEDVFKTHFKNAIKFEGFGFSAGF